MTTYTLIAFRPEASISCRGCTMETCSADLQQFFNIDQHTVIDEWANFLEENDVAEVGEYTVSIYIHQDNYLVPLVNDYCDDCTVLCNENPNATDDAYDNHDSLFKYLKEKAKNKFEIKRNARFERLQNEQKRVQKLLEEERIRAERNTYEMLRKKYETSNPT